MAKSTYQWLKIASVELCNRNCVGQYCWVHNAQLKQSAGAIPRIKCKMGLEMNILFVVNVDINPPILDNGTEKIER